MSVTWHFIKRRKRDQKYSFFELKYSGSITFSVYFLGLNGSKIIHKLGNMRRFETNLMHYPKAKDAV